MTWGMKTRPIAHVHPIMKTTTLPLLLALGMLSQGCIVVDDPGPQTSFVVGGSFGTYHRGLGTSVVVDNPLGTDAKALLRSADGRGLRCDLRGVTGVAGSGVCHDDQGLAYDVQLRRK